ncbi:LysR family transcriptional regulator [Pusillimonas sp.]|uniref:LysR family transcriptional regulator n=1 Tax=Pusillimonas sp. TaxID=3040095 RepID=UPI0037C85126
MNISLRQLKALVEIARLKSFTRAAENLHITQQGLSLMVQDIEKQFECRLFDRTTRTMSLTPSGKQLVDAAHQAISSLETAASTIGQLSSLAKSTLSVAITPLISASVVPQAQAIFSKKHPDVTVRIVDVERGMIQGLVESGEVDVGFGMFVKPSSGIQRRQIFQCDMVCISAPARPSASPLSRVRKLPWSELADRPLIGLPLDNPVQQLVDSHLAKISRGNEQRPTFNNIPTILAMVEAGFGSTILPSFVVSAARRLNVEVALMEDPVVPMNYFQINLKGRARAETESDFVQSLLEVMRSHCTLHNA